MPIPFTVIGGFLGAGKTTLLNHLLTQSEGVRYAVFVNDFGALNIDKRLIRSHGGRTIALENGCICCSLSDGLTQSLLALLSMEDPCDHIVIEASGVADPGPIADVAVLDPDLAPDGVVVLVDGADGTRWIDHDQVGEMVRKQIECADLLVINKTDLAEARDLVALRTRLDDLNGKAIRIETEHGKLAMPLAFSTAVRAPDGHGHHHGPDFQARTIPVTASLSRTDLTAALQALPSNVLRAKGFVRLSEDDRIWLLQMAGRRISLTPADDADALGVVLIGVGEMPETL